MAANHNVGRCFGNKQTDGPKRTIGTAEAICQEGIDNTKLCVAWLLGRIQSYWEMFCITLPQTIGYFVRMLGV